MPLDSLDEHVDRRDALIRSRQGEERFAGRRSCLGELRREIAFSAAGEPEQSDVETRIAEDEDGPHQRVLPPEAARLPLRRHNERMSRITVRLAVPEQQQLQPATPSRLA